MIPKDLFKVGEFFGHRAVLLSGNPSFLAGKEEWWRRQACAQAILLKLLANILRESRSAIEGQVIGLVQQDEHPLLAALEVLEIVNFGLAQLELRTQRRVEDVEHGVGVTECGFGDVSNGWTCIVETRRVDQNDPLAKTSLGTRTRITRTPFWFASLCC